MGFRVYGLGLRVWDVWGLLGCKYRDTEDSTSPAQISSFLCFEQSTLSKGAPQGLEI